MHERFDDVSRAVSYVASGIRADFPDRNFEVTVERRGTSTQYNCSTMEITRVLLDSCRRFPMASVYYTIDNPEAGIAEIHCHCRAEKSTACCRYSHPRSRVMLRLLPVSATEESAAEEGALSHT